MSVVVCKLLFVVVLRCLVVSVDVVDVIALLIVVWCCRCKFLVLCNWSSL